MIESLTSAIEIIKYGEENPEEFHNKYDENIIASGERLKEGCIFEFSLNKVYTLTIRTENYFIQEINLKK